MDEKIIFKPIGYIKSPYEDVKNMPKSTRESRDTEAEMGPIKGLFSTHAPNRPNPIGVSTIKIKEIKGNVIRFTGVDMLNGTPVLDIKDIL